MKVLLVEPDNKLADIYTKALQDAGHDVQSAARAQTAIHSADTEKPDIVLLELQLPTHNGVEFMYEFRSHAEWRDIPVILLTMVAPHSLSITNQQMSELGISNCLYKPATNLRQIVEAVEATA